MEQGERRVQVRRDHTRLAKVAVCGAGQWGRNLVRTFEELGALGGVVDPSSVIREQVREFYPAVPVYESYEPVLTDPSIRGVVIATPVATHFELARTCLLAGKDVYVEKPITLTVAEAVELNRLAQEREAVLMVGHLLLYQPAVQWIKRFVDSGGLGELCGLHQQRCKLGRVRRVEDVLWSFGVHDLAVLLHLVGEAPERVEVAAQTVLQPGIADDVHLHLGFGHGVQAHLHVSWLWPEQERRLVVVGTRGMLAYDEQTQTVTLHKKSVRDDLSIRDEGASVVFRGEEAPLRLECQHFLDCLRDRSKPLSDGTSAVEVIKVLERAQQRMKEGVSG
ncbi:MAG TPA: Gfo/Idh/MocA family oxidoreductase [Bacilli bacterium]|nr:Gfo/Idh/MocA family oxidoreductase [Bacilli bacterium]